MVESGNFGIKLFESVSMEIRSKKDNVVKILTKARKGLDGGITIPDGPNGWKIGGKKLTI